MRMLDNTNFSVRAGHAPDAKNETVSANLFWGFGYIKHGFVQVWFRRKKVNEGSVEKKNNITYVHVIEYSCRGYLL